MASKLNPGADATLVSVAYRAAMADTPADYSGTLEKAAESYGKTMEASSEMWGNIAKVGASIGSEMMKNAQELTDAVAKGATLNPEDTRLFYDEIYGVKDELKALGPLSMFGDRETRLKRAELKAKQQELFADIDNAVANLKVGADAVAAGTFDANLAMGDGEIVNAIIKSNLKNNITENQNIAKLSRNENGELMYTLYNVENNPDGEVLTDENGKPRTMTIKQFNESIATNVKDGGAMMTAFGSLTEEEANAGNKALNGTYDPERQQMTLNKLDTLLGDKPVNLKRAMRTPIGYSNTSFYDDLTNESALSAELYGMLNNVSGNENGELTGAVVDGIEDVDGSGGISENEINYDVLVANITGLKDPKASKEFFKQYAVKEMEAAYKYGYSKKPPVPGSGAGDGDDSNNYFGFGQFRVKTGGGGAQPKSITAATASQRRAYLDGLDQVDGEHGQYIWNEDLNNGQGMYVRQDDGKEMSMFDVARDEGLIKPGENKNNFNPKTQKTTNEENKYTSQNLAPPSVLKTKGDDATSDALNEIFSFSENSESDYFFTPYTRLTPGFDVATGIRTWKTADSIASNDIMLIDRKTMLPVMDGEKRRRFKTGSNFKQEDLDWINNFLSDYVSTPQVDDNTTYTTE